MRLLFPSAVVQIVRASTFPTYLMVTD